MNSKVLKVNRLRNNEYYDIQDNYDRLYKLSKEQVTFNKLMPLICDERNIKLAFRNIKRNIGSKTAGTDGKTISYYENWSTEKFVREIRARLRNYQPRSVRRVHIPKPNGKTRPLGIPCMIDRIIQQCILQVLEPICEAKFHPHSYGFRPNRSTEHAIARATSLINITKMHYVVDVDIQGFFDNINHGKLLKQMWHMGIRDKQLICVISKMLKSEIEGEGVQQKGTPQGGILSPLLSNIALNELDWWISDQWETFTTEYNYDRIRTEKSGRTRIDRSDKYRALRKTNLKEMFIVRYADDFKIFCRDYESAKKTYIATRNWLDERLQLTVSPEKSKITNIRKGKTEFLGFVFKGVKSKGKIVCHSHMSDKAREKIIDNLTNQVKLLKKEQSIRNISQFNSMILGYHNYYNKATHIAQDMGKINYRILVIMKNRLKNIYEDTQVVTKSYEKLYGNYRGRTKSIKGITLYPIYGCKTKNCKSFIQQTCNYTREGRNLKHKSLSYYNVYVKHLLRNSYNDSVELADNKLALIYGQRGLCYITKEPLIIGEMECHHKKPRSKGGTDKYNNLMWLNKKVHKLIHATEETTIHRYLRELSLDKEQIKVVNKFRNLAGNLDILI